MGSPSSSGVGSSTFRTVKKNSSPCGPPRHAGKGRAELAADARCPVRFRCFIERKKRGRSRRELIHPDVAGRKDSFRGRDRRYRVRPAGVEREMGDDLGNLARHAIVAARSFMFQLLSVRCVDAKDNESAPSELIVKTVPIWSLCLLSAENELGYHCCPAILPGA